MKNLAKGTSLFIGGATSNIWIIGGCYGNRLNESPVKVQGSPAPDHVTLDGVTIHDAERDNTTAHMECAYIADAQYVTIRNSRFLNCAIFDLVFTNLSGVNPAHVVVENNFFDATASHAGANRANSQGYGTLAIYAVRHHAERLHNSKQHVLRHAALRYWIAVKARRLVE